MGTCNLEHRKWDFFDALPEDQGGVGRHKCCGCAYEQGYQAGLMRAENMQINLSSLPESQAGTVRHRSPHAAFAMGYYEGVQESYR